MEGVLTRCTLDGTSVCLVHILLVHVHLKGLKMYSLCDFHLQFTYEVSIQMRLMLVYAKYRGDDQKGASLHKKESG